MSRLRAKMKPRVKREIKPIWLVTSGLAVGCLILFLVIFIGNMVGIQFDSLAEKINPGLGKSQPLSLEEEKALADVNFLVLNKEVNSAYEEVRPLITGDGQMLYFSRRNHPANISNQRDDQDIWCAILDVGGNWSVSENLGESINSSRADAICSVSPDGNTIIFLREKMERDRPLLRAVKTDNGWGKPESVQVDDFYNLDPYVDFYWSFESNVLFMAVNREGSKGGQDLYYSLPTGKDHWSKPRSLGKVINTKESDFAPFLAPDGKTLYFSSYGHQGYGGCDIFMTTRLDDTWENWSDPVNLGPGINSNREESYFSISGDGKYIYFESYDKEKKERDIFRADLPEHVKPLGSKSEEYAQTMEVYAEGR